MKSGLEAEIVKSTSVELISESRWERGKGSIRFEQALGLVSSAPFTRIP